MTGWLSIWGVVIIASLMSLMFSTLTYSLRDFSKAKLEEYLARHNKSEWFEKTIALQSDLAFATAVGRLLANILVLIGIMHFLRVQAHGWSDWAQYLVAIVMTGFITLLSSVAVPHALAEHAGEKFIGSHVKFLHALLIVMTPATRVMHAIDRTVAQATDATGPDAANQTEHDIEQEILSVVEEGEKEGVMDAQERVMIESVIQFRDTSVGQVMTARPDIIAMPITASLDEVKQLLDDSGHSRVPVYESTLDHIVGILYARDLLKHLGLPPEQFNIRSAIRSAFYVPETKPLRDLLRDFRQKKVHMAIVLDEYGGTAGLVTIEDVLEELVGDISDEHEPHEPSMIKRLNETTVEADARVRLEDFNRVLGVNLPEDAGYETLGGFISNTLGRIPQAGSQFDHPGLHFTILDAEPQKLNRVKIELIPQPADAQTPTNA
jgi:putative hemolysin